MGEARRRSEQGLKPRSKKNSRNESPRIVSWFPVTQAQRDQFIESVSYTHLTLPTILRV